MGRPSKLTDAQWEAISKRLLAARDNEGAATEMLRLMLQFGHLESAWGIPRITGHRFEFPVHGGRIDLLLFHADGGVSIVEAKAFHNTSGLAAGIGQLCVYATLIHDALGKYHHAYVRRILTAPIEPERSVTIMAACEMAGVEFAHLPPFRVLQQQLDRLRLKAA